MNFIINIKSDRNNNFKIRKVKENTKNKLYKNI